MLRELLAQLPHQTREPTTNTPCPACNGKGSTTLRRNQRRYSAPCPTCHPEHQNQLPTWQTHDLEQLYEPEYRPEYINQASRFAELATGSLFITGPKADQLAVATGNAIQRQHRLSPRFARAQTIINELELDFRNSYPQLTRNPCLVIIQMPTPEEVRPRETRLIQEMLLTRDDHRLVTIVAVQHSHSVPEGFTILDTGNGRHYGLIPEDLAQAMTFDTISPSSRSLASAIDILGNWTQAPNGWLLITGGSGTGKTHLTVAATQSRATRGDKTYFQTADTMLDDLRRAVQLTQAHYDTLLGAIIHSDCLAVDDLQVARETPFSNEQLFKIFNQRYLARLPTIVNTNLNPEQLSKSNPSLASRLRDTQLVQHVHINAPDHRIHRGQEPEATP